MDTRVAEGGLVGGETPFGVLPVDEGSAVLPMECGGQPRPVGTWVCHHGGSGREVSALCRAWAGDDHLRCRLCPPGQCVAEGGICLIQVDGHVDAKDAPLFSTARLRLAPGRDVARTLHHPTA